MADLDRPALGQPGTHPAQTKWRRPEGWLFVLPALLFVVFMAVYPMFYLLRLSLTRWQMTGPRGGWVGLDNYVTAATDPRVHYATFLTAGLVIAVVALEFLLGLGLALVLVEEFRGRRWAIAILLLPAVVVPVVAGFTWKLMWDTQLGPVNQVLGWIVGHSVEMKWLGSTWTALFAIVVTDLWQWTPFMFLVLLAGLAGLPREVYEAARVDGAGAWVTFTRITLPLLRRTAVLAISIRALDAFKIFDSVFALTQGGPGTSTEVTTLYLYRMAFQYFRLDHSAAITVILLILLSVVITIVLNRVTRQGGAEA